MIPKNEYNPYFEQYMQLVPKNKSIIDNLYDSQKEFEDTLRMFLEKADFAYAAGKWTLKQVIQHIVDTERIFCYRALCFSRNDKTELPGFDQDLFVNNADLSNRHYYDILDEMDALRISTIHLFESFTDEELLRTGIASGNEISVRALGYLFTGHQMHHFNIIKERYL